MGQVVESTDYSTECGMVPLTFIQMLASCIVGYDDLDGERHFYINVIGTTENCDDLEDLVDCNTNQIDAERLLVENVFALDECGNLAIKMLINQGEEGV
jgi:hypothetical protein